MRNRERWPGSRVTYPILKKKGEEGLFFHYYLYDEKKEGEKAY